MLAGWDRLQDLRRRQPATPEPIQVATVPLPVPQPEPMTLEHQVVTEPAVIDAVADKLAAQNKLRTVAKNMSLLGKLQHLTESAQDFHKETEAVLDGIGEKIAAGKKKRDEAAGKHHAYYDAIIAGVDESTKVIDRLSNGPLHGDGQ